MLRKTGVSMVYGIGAMHAIQTQSLPRDLKTPARMLLLVLASHADNKTGMSFPSQGVLAEECGMAVSAVQRNLKVLVDAGLVEVQHRTVENAVGNRVKMTNIYKVKNIPRFIGQKGETRTTDEKLTDRSWAE